MKVVVYNFENNLKEAFIQMNLKWISEMFKVEEEDKRVLSTIDDSIKNGAKIYFTIENNIPVSCLMLYKIDNDTYELCKFASTKEVKGAGGMVLDYALKDAESFAKRIFIATNTKCEAAIHLYEKYGFKVFNSNNTYGFSSDRVNICYEKYLN